MNKMKSLLWREYMLGRKKMLFSLLAYAMITVLCWLTVVSIKHGNLYTAFKNMDKEMPGMSQGLSVLVYYAAMFIPVIASISLMSENGSVSADLKSGWKLFSRTMPVTAEERLGAKYILKTASTAFSFIIDLGNLAVVSLLADRDITATHINVLLLIINMSLLSEFIKGVVLYGAKTEKQTIMADLACFAAWIVIYVPYFFRLKKYLSGIDQNNNIQTFIKLTGFIADDMKKLFPFMIPIMIALIAGGYFLHLTIIRRAEK